MELALKPLTAEISYSWQRFPGLGLIERSFNLSLTWYYSWNLKRKRHGKKEKTKNKKD